MKIIKTKKEYKKALKRIEKLMDKDLKEGTKKYKELDHLVTIVLEYEDTISRIRFALVDTIDIKEQLEIILKNILQYGSYEEDNDEI